jgi:hypothetical protein
VGVLTVAGDGDGDGDPDQIKPATRDPSGAAEVAPPPEF